MTPAQELRIIIQSLTDWQSKHLRVGEDNNVFADEIISQMDELEENLTENARE